MAASIGSVAPDALPRPPKEVTRMKKIAIRKTDSIKLTTLVVGPGYAAC